jgi:hypothetical protein
MPPKTFREFIDRYQLGERSFSGSQLDDDPKEDLAVSVRRSPLNGTT